MTPKHTVRFAVCFSLLSLASCSGVTKIDLESATIDQKTGVMSATIPTADLENLKKNEVYYSLVLSECGHEEDNYYPGKPISGGADPKNNQYSVIKSVIPKYFLSKTAHGCALLRGGSYFHGKYASNVIKAFDVSADGFGK